MAYLWQLVPLEEQIKKRETYRVHALLHIPQNSCTLAALFWMHKYGSPKIPCLLASAWAAASRTALRTVVTWRQDLVALEKWAWDHGDIRRAARKLWSPPAWDTVAIVEHLASAASPEALKAAGHPKLALGLAQAIAKAESLDALAKKPRLQAALYNHYLEALHPDDVEVLAARRLREYGVADPAARLEQTLSAARRLPPETAWSVLLTAFCSWITARRMQDTTRQLCLCGCWGRLEGEPSADDDFRHYLVCRKLAFVIRKAAPGVVGGLLEWLLPPEHTPLSERKKMAARIGMAVHIHRSLRLSLSLYALAANGEVSLLHRSMRQHYALLGDLARSAAHKFSAAYGERLGYSLRRRLVAASDDAAS